jgi:hypothetical protein
MTGHTQILWSPQARAKAKRLIDAAPLNAVVTIKPEKRSTEQNSKMWAMLTDVSVAKPEGRAHIPEVWKELFMHSLGYAARFEMGLDGQPFPCGFKSSRLTKQQMSDLIEVIYEYGARHNVKWTEPEMAA